MYETTWICIVSGSYIHCMSLQWIAHFGEKIRRAAEVRGSNGLALLRLWVDNAEDFLGPDFWGFQHILNMGH